MATLGSFRSLVSQMVARSGLPYLEADDTGDLNQLMQEALNVYAARTEFLYQTKEMFYPIVGQSEYRTFNPQFNDAIEVINGLNVRILEGGMCKVRQVTINGNPLQMAGCGDFQDFAGVAGGGGGYNTRYGESSEDMVLRVFAGYANAGNGLPAYWFQSAPNTVVFSQPFDQIYANSWFSGVQYHTVLSGLDSQVLDLPPEDVRPAALLARNYLLQPFSPESVCEGTPLFAEVEYAIKQRMAASSTKSSGYVARGLGRSGRIATDLAY